MAFTSGMTKILDNLNVSEKNRSVLEEAGVTSGTAFEGLTVDDLVEVGYPKLAARALLRQLPDILKAEADERALANIDPETLKIATGNLGYRINPLIQATDFNQIDIFTTLQNHDEFGGEIKATVDDYRKSVDLPKIFGNFVNCGNLVATAQAAAGAFPCAIPISKLARMYVDYAATSKIV